jgi:uncharacterized membrane protein YwzB
MDHDEARTRMLEIQRIMESATLFTLLPSWAAILGGVFTLIGCGTSYWALGSANFAEIMHVSQPTRINLCIMWLVIALAAITGNVLLTARMARQQRVPLRVRPSQVAMLALTPCVVVATALTFQFFFITGPTRPDEVRYIAPVWMMLYGAGVYSAGLFSVRAPRVLGMAFILAGIVTLFGFLDYSVIAVGLSFGLLHLIFGLYILNKQRQSPSP